MKRMMGLGLLALATVGCTAVRTTPTAAPTAAPTMERCVENWGDGQVQIKWENTMSCDMVPPQELIVIIDELSWAEQSGSVEGWGGDASLAWADEECDDMGGRKEWHGGDWLVCWDTDY